MRWFVGISLVCHAVLMLAVVDLEFSRTDIPDYDVYEVAIVSSAPPARQSGTSAKAPGKTYVYRKGSDTMALSGVKKEKALQDRAPKLSPADLEPVKRQDEEPLPDSPAETGDDLAQGLKEYESAQGEPMEAAGKQGSSDAITLWKAQVRSLVDSHWKTPPEVSIVDMSLKTTYLLKITRSGELLDKRLLVPSGNSPFDRSVLLALNSIKRLPQPPLVLIAGRDTVELTMSFTPPKGAQ